MYYYITEPPRSREVQQAEEKVRELLIQAGIAGEFVCTSPTRGVEELAEMGVAKKYTTLVAIGSEPHLNTLGTLLAGTSYVFGALPITRPDALASVNDVRTFEEGVEALKFRRVHAVPVCRIEPNKFFFSELHLQSSHVTNVRIRINDALVETPCHAMTFTGSGQLTIEHRIEQRGAASSLRNFFFKDASVNVERSQFQGNVIAIETSQPLTFHLGAEAFVRTPLAATIIPNSLKIITRRDTLAALSDQKSEGTEVVFQTNNW
ncbi:MAG: hypothetical protein AAB701_01910 [Patescibacteria group bacterium]